MKLHAIPIEEMKHSQTFFSRKIPRGGLVFLYVLVFVLVAAGVYAALGTIDEWARGNAVLRPLAEVATVRNETPDRVSGRFVRHGDQVASGQVLWSIDTTVIESEVAGYRAERERLVREIGEQRAVMQSLQMGSNRFSEALPYARTQVDLLLAQLERLRLQVEAARVAYERANEAPASLRRADQVEELERAYRMSQIELDSFVPQELVSRTERVRILEAQLRDVERSLISAEQQLSTARVVAPVGGTVEIFRDFSVGEFVGVGEGLMRIIPPQSDRFRLIVEVNEAEAAEIGTGQRMVLRFNGFPAAEYGSVSAEVEYVPRDAAQSVSGGPVYHVRAELDETYLTDRDGRTFPLRPGMSAEARIITRTTPIYRFLLSKLDIRL